jgi:hypothetical protein
MLLRERGRCLRLTQNFLRLAWDAGIQCFDNEV